MHFRGLDFCIRIALLAIEQIWCCVEAKEEAMHPNAFIEAAKMHLAMLPLVFNCKYKKTNRFFGKLNGFPLNIRKKPMCLLLFSIFNGFPLKIQKNTHRCFFNGFQL